MTTGQDYSTVSEQFSTYGFDSMSEHQRWIFEQYLIARCDSHYNGHEPIWLALILAGSKPAASIMGFVDPLDPDNDTPPPSAFPIEEIAQTFDLAYRWWSTNEVFVTTTPWRFDLLPTNDDRTSTPGYHRRLGCFFGYPEQDIEYFLNTAPPYPQPGDLVAEGLFQPAEIAYTTFVPQRHATSIAGYERAIAIGKANRDTIATCAEQWGIPALDAYAECGYHSARTDCLMYV